MDGFEYINGQIERIAHAEGYISRREKRLGESNEFVGIGGLVWQYNYTLKDHLGNTRVTFADTTGDRTINPVTEVNQVNHYYPYGLNMEGNWNGASPLVKNKYQYGDKELQTDFGLNWNDFGARMYDPAIGRWLSPDPLADARNWVSPYQYVQNNPINRIDPTGMLDQSQEQKDRAMSQTTRENEKWMNESRNDGGYWASVNKASSIAKTRNIKGLDGTGYTITDDDIALSVKIAVHNVLKSNGKFIYMNTFLAQLLGKPRFLTYSGPVSASTKQGKRNAAQSDWSRPAGAGC
jgi:RHS repeat-associated protein